MKQAVVYLFSERLLPRVRAWFRLSQAELGLYLGLGKAMVSQVERGVRPLPRRAEPLRDVLAQAQQATPLEPDPEPLDVAALRLHQRHCELRAAALAQELTLLPGRAAWARRRLAALPLLRRLLAARGAELPTWLLFFEDEARQELARSGHTAQARLRLRQAALAFEAAQTAELLAKEASAGA